jgi:hypothetical protein
MMTTIVNGWSRARRHSRQREIRLACVLGLFSIALAVDTAPAQIGSQPTPTDTPNARDAAGETDDAHARWTESLGEPSIYVHYARTDVDQRHYRSAARNLRKAAAVLAEQMENAYGLDRRRLAQDVAALRLTARDVGAGAITSSALLDSVLDTTHTHLRERGSAP